MMNAILVKAFLFICIFSLYGCSEEERSDIRFGLSSAPQNLDPRFATDATSSRVNRLLYRQLVSFDKNYKPVADLAQWTMLSPKEYRFTLKESGRLFHNGERLTSADVAATFNFILDKSNGSPHRGTLAKRIHSFKVIDENTLDFNLHYVDPLFPAYLGVGILPKSLMDAGHPFSQQPVGSGVFKFIEWPKDGKLTLQRISDDLVLTFIKTKDPSVRVLKLVRGEIDLLQNDLPKELVGFLKKQDSLDVTPFTGSNFSYVGFNLKDPLTGNLGIRQAIADAIDRRATIKYLLNNAARPANAFFPADHWAANNTLGQYEHDPNKAIELLKSLGYDKQNPLQLTYKTSTNPLRVRIATVIQNQLSKVGIELDVRTYDFGTFFADIKKGNFQMYSLSWVGIKTPDIFEYVFDSKNTPDNKGANRGHYHNETVDGLIKKALSAEVLTEKAAYYQEIQAILFADLPYVPLWYEDHFIATAKHIHGYSVPVDGNYDGLKVIQRR